jgi:cell division FtsZ-interacting protein ZapD
MIEVIKEIEDDYVLIHIIGTRQYQIWNILDLMDVIRNIEEEDIPQKLTESFKKFTIWNDNSDIDEDKLKRLVGYIKEFKLEKIELDKQK